MGGRKPKIKPNQRAEILRMVNSGKTSGAEAAWLFGLHRFQPKEASSHRSLSGQIRQPLATQDPLGMFFSIGNALCAKATLDPSNAKH